MNELYKAIDKLKEDRAALLEAATQILDDFDNYGEVLQTDPAGEYGRKSTIEKLRQAIAKAEVTP